MNPMDIDEVLQLSTAEFDSYNQFLQRSTPLTASHTTHNAHTTLLDLFLQSETLTNTTPTLSRRRKRIARLLETLLLHSCLAQRRRKEVSRTRRPRRVRHGLVWLGGLGQWLRVLVTSEGQTNAIAIGKEKKSQTRQCRHQRRLPH